VTLDSTSLFKTASSSKGKASRSSIHPSEEDLLRGHQNTRVRILSANDPENKLHIPLQIFCDNNEKELNNNAIIVCEHEGIWHQVLFPGEKATLRQPKEFIHQYDIPDQSTEELAVLLDHQARISPASQTISLQTPTTPSSPAQESTITTTTTKATTSTTSTAATTITPDDIKKAFEKGLRQNNPGGGGGGGSGGSRGGGGGGGGSGGEGRGGGEGEGGGGGGGGGAPSQQVILLAQDEQLMGQLPSVFDGDRTKAKAFMEEVKGYICLNMGVNGFHSPMKKMAFVLTLIKGDDVQGWVESMGTILDRLNPLVDNIPDVWNHFCNEFAEQFLDTTEQETAQTNLQKLRMEPGKIDQYISKFKELARRANYTVGNEETARLFLEGLTTQVMQDVLTTDRLHRYEDYKRRAVNANRNRSILFQILQSRDTRQKEGALQYSLGQ
jgi:Retrotransposon gag protein